MIRKSILLFVLGIPACATADDAALSILAASTGQWQGELYYLDYQSGDRCGIPLQIDARITPDGATVVRHLMFTDPHKLVYAASVLTVGQNGNDRFAVFFRDRDAEFFSYSVTSVTDTNPDHWQVVYELDGTDDNRPARIRHTLTRKETLMTSTKEAQFLDEQGECFSPQRDRAQPGSRDPLNSTETTNATNATQLRIV